MLAKLLSTANGAQLSRLKYYFKLILEFQILFKFENYIVAICKAELIHEIILLQMCSGLD